MKNDPEQATRERKWIGPAGVVFACRAMGLSLSANHRLLGEAARRGGQIVIANMLPPAYNEEYDTRSRFETKCVLV